MSNPANGTLGTLYVLNGTAVNAGKLGLLVVAATVNVADPAGLTDGVGSHLSLDATGRLRVALSSAAPFAVVTPPLVDSIGVTTTTAAPGAGAVLATLTPAAGTWDIQAWVYFSVGGTKNNAEFRKGAGVVSSLLLPAAVATAVPPPRVFRAVLNGATTVTINATAADAAGTYEAELIATRVG
jgi:hypothetical protein